MKKWEYGVHKMGEASSEDTKKYLDNMGNYGWRLISVVRSDMYPLTFFFKRKKSKKKLS